MVSLPAEPDNLIETASAPAKLLDCSKQGLYYASYACNVVLDSMHRACNSLCSSRWLSRSKTGLDYVPMHDMQTRKQSIRGGRTAAYRVCFKPGVHVCTTCMHVSSYTVCADVSPQALTQLDMVALEPDPTYRHDSLVHTAEQNNFCTAACAGASCNNEVHPLKA